MIKNKKKLTNFNNNLIRKEKLSRKQALAVYESMHREALALGVINSKNILEGIEVDIRLARALNKLKP